MIKHAVKRRTFGIGRTHAQFTVIPKSAYEHPLYFLGTPFPFLRQHIQAFGTLLFGSPIATQRWAVSRKVESLLLESDAAES